MPENALGVTIRRLTALEQRARDGAVVESPVTFGDLHGAALALPGLRGWWPMNATDERGNGYVSDESGQLRSLVNNGVTFAVLNNIVRYGVFGGSHSLSRLSEPGLEIAGALTIGGWFYANSVSSRQALIGKYGASAGQHSYLLEITAGGVLQALLSADGDNDASFTHTSAPAANTWFFAAAVFDPGVSVTIYLNNEIETITDSVPASLYGADTTFRVGGRHDGSYYLAGRASAAFIAAGAAGESLMRRFFSSSRLFFGV